MIHMGDYIYILIPVGILIIVVAAIALFLGIKKGRAGGVNKTKFKGKDRNIIIKEANRRLAQNPKDAEALLALAELYYREGLFDKAIKTFEVLVDLCATNPDLDEFEITLKYGLSAMKLKKYEEAYKSLVIARSIKQDVFEINFNLGHLEYLRKSYEKAAKLLAMARKDQPEHVETLRYLGLSLFKLQKYSEAAALIRKAIDLEPDDKEALFILGQAYHNLGQNDQSIKIFTHLRPDPVWGPSAALYAGTIHLNTKQHQKAIMDFEIGLKHENIKSEILVELKYRLASCYIQTQELGQAIRYYKEIQNEYPGYRDVPNLLAKYGELNTNRNLQTYLISPTSDFVTLCRKISLTFFPGAKVKITDVSVQRNEFADILTEVSTKKWEDIVLFRYIRSSGQVGELVLRDLYARSKEMKAGRGFCLTAGEFSEEARRFVEARLIDLIEKDKLIEILNSIS